MIRTIGRPWVRSESRAGGRCHWGRTPAFERGHRGGPVWCIERLVLTVILGQVFKVTGVVILRVPIVGDEAQPSCCALQSFRHLIRLESVTHLRRRQRSLGPRLPSGILMIRPDTRYLRKSGMSRSSSNTGPLGTVTGVGANGVGAGVGGGSSASVAWLTEWFDATLTGASWEVSVSGAHGCCASRRPG